jgi:hypothetical protein
MFIARKSNNIEADIKRNWSSWNMGQGGFAGTRAELDEYLATAKNSGSVSISYFEIAEHELKDYQFGELYENYWVVIDQRFINSIAGTQLDADTLDEAITEALNGADYSGDGIAFDARKAVLVHSEDDIHIFEIKD